MDFYRRIRMMLIAAGFIISAAFYVQIGGGGELLYGDESASAFDDDKGDSSPDEAESDGDDSESAAGGYREDESLSLSELQGLSERQRREVLELIESKAAILREELSEGAGKPERAGIESGEGTAAGEQEDKAEAAPDTGLLKEGSGGNDPAGPELSGHGRININTASMEELMELKGIGETRARAIIEYRETYGDFGYIEEIMNVSGIKEASFEKIKDDICV